MIDNNKQDNNERINGTVTLKELVNGIPVPIFLKDISGLFLGCNPSFTHLFGFEEYDLIGKTSYDISPKEEADEYSFRDKEILRHQGIQIYEGTITNKFGHKHNVIFRKSILKDPNDEIVAIVGVIIDITKRKNIEKSLWEYRNKLHEMVFEKTEDITKKNLLLEKEIEKRKKSEDELRQQEYLLRTILNSTYDAIIVFDVSGQIVNVNNKTKELFKVKEPFFSKLNFFDDLSAIDNEIDYLNEKWDNVINDNDEFFEWYAKTPYENEVFTTEIYLRKIIISSKIHILANIRDITERKKTDELLLQEHNKVKIALKHEMLISTIATIFNSTDDFFSVIDYALEIISSTLNIKDVQFVPFIKESFDDLKHKKWLNIAYEYYLAQVMNTTDLDTEIVSAKQLVNTLLSKILQSISVFWVDLSETVQANRTILEKHNVKSFAAVPLKFQGNIDLLSSIKSNVKIYGMLTFESAEPNVWTSKHFSLFNTIANMLSNAWGKHLQTVARINAEMKNAESVQLLENSARLASIGVMASGITHEINQPLNAIKVTADTILFQERRMPGIYPENLVNKLKNISLATNRIDEIIRHMKSFWSLNEKVKEDKFEIHEAICHSIDILKKQMSLHNIDIFLTFLNQTSSPYNEKDLKTMPIIINGNRIHFEQIIINLVVNAYHSLEKSNQIDKFIKIDTEYGNDFYLVRITDNGIGFPENFENKLFDPFYSTKKPGKGMGLGLAIVKFFMDNFKGSIKAFNNEIHQGACFELYFKKD
ncbi:MAG: PAS domain S-box protein [Candidatus Cloacimonetes bacterium]|nr:PAS domain S-box protein [Candidatus Cloacimonadota bacterium]